MHLHRSFSVLALVAAQAGAQTPPPLQQVPDAAIAGTPRIIRGNDVVVSPQSVFAAPAGSSTNFRFEDAPIRDVAQAILGDLLKLDFVMHPPVDGRVTLVTQAGISPDGAIYLLESALQASGVALVRDARGTYHIGKPDVIRSIVPAARVAGGGPIAPGQGVVIIPLRFIGATEMATILRPMVTPDAILRVDTVRNLLVMNGSRTQAEGWLSLVQTFDVDLLKGMSVGVFPLKYATVREVEAALALLSPVGPRPAGAPGGAAAATAVDSNPLAGAFRILPIERLNSILVVTPRAAYLDEARRWIEQLDRPGNNALEPRLHVYAVRNGSAAHLAAVLNGIFGDGKAQSQAPSGVAPGLATARSATVGGAPAAGGGVGAAATSGMQSGGRSAVAQGGSAVSRVQLAGDVRVVADELNNAILVYGTPADFARVESALQRLDVPVVQVLIEASIVEVTLDDTMKFGLQWTFSNAFNNDRFSGTGVVGMPGGGSGGSSGEGFRYTLSNALGVRAVLDALAKKSLVRVLSTPSLMVLDNHTASINVGDQVPIQSSQTITEGGNISTSIQYKDTGVALSVLPSVNIGDMVTMQISQAVTDVGLPDGATGQRSFLQRQISSKVAVRSGETIVLGGLIRENANTGSSGIPLLHEIPLLGALFGQKASGGRRTELLVIITPRVVRSDQDARDIGRDLRQRMPDFTNGLTQLGRGPRAGLPLEPEFVPPPVLLAPFSTEPSGPNTP